MHGTVFVQNGDVLRFQHIRGNCCYRDFLTILPELHPGFAQHTGGIFIGFRQPDYAFDFHLVVFQPAPILQQVIPGKTHLHIQGGLLHTVGFPVLGDVGGEFLQQFRLITAGCLRELRHDAFHLSGGECGNIYILRFSVLGDQANNIRGFQRSGGSAACDLFICHDRSGHRAGSQACRVDLVFLQILENIGRDFTGLQLSDIRAFSQLLIGADNGCHIRGVQTGNISARSGFRILCHIGHKPFWRKCRLVSAIRLLGVLRHKSIHQRLLFCRVLRFRIALDHSIRRDGSRVSSPFFPAGFRAGHVQIRSDLQHLVADRFTKHLIQAGQVGVPFIILQECLNGSQLFQSCREVNIREHGFDFILGQAAVQQGLDLCQQSNVFSQSSFIHAGSQLLQIRQKGFLLSIGLGCAVLTQKLHQFANLSFGFLHVFTFPYRRDHVSH